MVVESATDPYVQWAVRRFVPLMFAFACHAAPEAKPVVARPTTTAATVASAHVADAGWRYRGTPRTLAARGARIVNGPSRDVMLAEIGRPSADEPLAAGTNGMDLDGRAFVRKTVHLTGCREAPHVEAPLAISGTPKDGITITTPEAPKLVDLGTAGSASAFDLDATFDCAGAWQKWLAAPIADALREARVQLNAREYVVPPKEDLQWNNPTLRDASKAFVDAGGHYGVLDGAEGKTFAPATPAFETYHLRVVAPQIVDCVTQAGNVQGRSVEYRRELGGDDDRRYLVTRTDRALVIGNGLLVGMSFDDSGKITQPEDKTCGRDLVPKLVDSRAAALAAHVPAAVLDQDDPKVDFSKESLVILGRPKAIDRAQGEIHLTIDLPRDGHCPGGRPPQLDPVQRTTGPPAPGTIDAQSVATAYIVPKGRLPVVQRIFKPAPKCLPMP